MTDITHDYQGMGKLYADARKGTPAFAKFMIENSGLEQAVGRPLHIVEFGVGGGQQTKFVEDELVARGIQNYIILAQDKSFRSKPDEAPGQLDILRDRIEAGEISARVVPYPYDVDRGFLIPSDSIDLSYFAFVIHHLKNRGHFFSEVGRTAKKGARFFSFDAALEDLANHPLDEFFPDKIKYDSLRYPTKDEIRKLFENAGFAYQQRQPILRDDEKPIDEKFLASVQNMTINSVLKMIAENNPIAFAEGVERVKKVVEEGRNTGNYRTFKIYRTVDWGIKI